MFSNKLYDVLKWIALLFVPALETFVLSISQIWGMPYGEPIALTIGAVGLFLGACIGVSTINYNNK